MTDGPEVRPRIRARFAWSVVAFYGLLYVPFCVLVFVGPWGVANEGITSQIGLSWLACLGLGIPAGVNLLFLDYIELSDSEVHKQSWFGLVHKRLPISQLTKIGVERRRMGTYQFTFTFICIRSANDVIELNLEFRWEGEVGEVVCQLADRGVPVDEKVPKRFLGKKRTLSTPKFRSADRSEV